MLDMGRLSARSAAEPQLALVDTNAHADTFGRKAFRRIAILGMGINSDFRHQAERSVGSLVYPSTPEDALTRRAAEISIVQSHSSRKVIHTKPLRLMSLGNQLITPFLRGHSRSVNGG